jgi:hypothetical protein
MNRATGGDRPELPDAVSADADITVVEVDRGVAVAGDEADLVAYLEPVGGAGDAEAAVLVGGALVGGGGFVPTQRRARIEGERPSGRRRQSRGPRSGGSSPSPIRKGSARRPWSGRRRGRDCGRNRRP